MKSRLLLLFIPVILFATACTKTSSNNVTPNQTILTTVSSNQWSSTDGGKTYSSFINMPEIDSYQNKYGAVLVYATYDNGKTFEQVPEVYAGIAYSFIHSVGQVEIDIQASNGTSIITPPGSVGIKIVLVPSSL